MTLLDVTSPDGCSTWQVETDAWTSLGEQSPAVTGMAAAIAVSNLYRLTGSRYGRCNRTYRPTMQRKAFTSSWRTGGQAPGIGDLNATNLDWYAAGVTGTTFGTACRHSTREGRALVLPVSPIHEVVAMDVEGDPVDLAKLAVLNRREIVRRDAEFPSFQNVFAPIGDPNTWSITVDQGVAYPPETPFIVGMYANELGKALSTGKCNIPANARSIQRQGITYDLVDDGAYLERGLVGHPIVDRFILSVNPNGLIGPPKVYSIEDWRGDTVRETWVGS